MLLPIRTALLASLMLALAGTCTADANSRRLPPAAPAVTYDAVVTVDGALARGTGATSVRRAGRGIYFVSFDADLSACVVVAAFGRATTDGGSYEKPGFIATGLAEDTDTIWVSTSGVNGRERERSFHLIVGC